MTRRPVLALPALAVLALARPVQAQRVQGIVLDEVSHQPIPAADVALLGVHGEAIGHDLTGADGRFAIKIPKLDTYAVKVEALGYIIYTTKVFVADTTQLVSTTIDLEPAPLALQGLKVTGTAVDPHLLKRGFYRRKAQGIGDFLTPAQVENERPFYASDLLERMPGLVVRPDRGGFGHTILSDEGLHACRMKIVVDGQSLAPDESVDTRVGAQEVRAVEVYPFHGVGAPMRYRVGLDAAGARCGIVVIWTKNG